METINESKTKRSDLALRSSCVSTRAIASARHASISLLYKSASCWRRWFMLASFWALWRSASFYSNRNNQSQLNNINNYHNKRNYLTARLSLSMVLAVWFSKLAICRIFLSFAITASMALYALSALFRLSIIAFPYEVADMFPTTPRQVRVNSGLGTL